jgi:hypothetical protein
MNSGIKRICTWSVKPSGKKYNWIQGLRGYALGPSDPLARNITGFRD